MVEGQSRYGIMQELNEKKITEKKSLAELEQATDTATYNAEKELETLKRTIADENKGFEREYQDWKRDKEMTLKLTRSEHSRAIKEAEDELSDKAKNYKPQHEASVNEKSAKVEKLEEDIRVFKEAQEKKAVTKREIITAIEQGIKDLKDISKEQGSKE